MVGGRAAVARLSPHIRAEIRKTALALHSVGRTFENAAEGIESLVRDGFVYVVTNPAWPHCVKIGSAVDVQSRLNAFQTGCPLRAYRVAHSVYVSDRRAVEAAAHDYFKPFRVQGEWFEISVNAAARFLDGFAEFDPRAFFENSTWATEEGGKCRS